MEICDLPPNIKPTVVAEFLGYSLTRVYGGIRNYTARMEALEAKLGHPVDHDSDDALPCAGEIPGRYLMQPALCSDGKYHGGSIRVYRDLLLWMLYGQRDYGHRKPEEAAS